MYCAFVKFISSGCIDSCYIHWLLVFYHGVLVCSPLSKRTPRKREICCRINSSTITIFIQPVEQETMRFNSYHALNAYQVVIHLISNQEVSKTSDKKSKIFPPHLYSFYISTHMLIAIYFGMQLSMIPSLTEFETINSAHIFIFISTSNV